MLTRKARNKKIYCQLKHYLDANFLKNEIKNREPILLSSSSSYILKYLYIHHKSKGAKERLLGQTLKTKIPATTSNPSY